MSGPGLELFLCGDVMTGRGIDQILPHPSRPHLFEPYVSSALEYVEMAEEVNGPIPRPVAPSYVWGDALEVMERREVDARIVNLETSVTTSEDALPKGINYRMHPRNVGVLEAAGIDCCTVANNHVLDWGVAGLEETLATLDGRGLRPVGAGRDLDAAAAPAVIDRGERGRILVFSFCVEDSGVPPRWAAAVGRPGVNLLPELSRASADGIGRRVEAAKGPGDVVVASIHWGGNWGYDVPRSHRRFAHALIDYASVDLVYGHSSHHPKGVEIHRDRPILYGCGDLLNDYEGIGGTADFRSDLVLAYFPAFALSTGVLERLELVPFQIRNFRLTRPTGTDRRWLLDRMDRECRRFGCGLAPGDGGFLLEW